MEWSVKYALKQYNMHTEIDNANGDDLHTMVMLMKHKIENYAWYRMRREWKMTANGLAPASFT